MKTWKRTSAGLMAFAMLLTACPAINANAETDTELKYGPLTYEIDEDNLIVISGFDKSVTEVVIPAEIDGNLVLGIEEYVFENCTELTSVTISEGIMAIADGAFQNCTGLTEITIPGSVFGISDSAFAGCTGLKTVNLEEGVQIIYEGTFTGCTSLAEITLPDSLITLSENVFTGTPVLENQTGTIRYVSDWLIDCEETATDFTIKDGTKGIAACAFENCENLVEISIPDSVYSVCDDAFLNTPLYDSQEGIIYADNWMIGYDQEGDITVREGTTGIVEGVLALSDITKLELPESLRTIGMMGMAYTTLETLTLPDSVKNLGPMTFTLSMNLAEATIGNSVETIPIMAFMGCTSLKTITIPKSVKKIDFAAFMGCTSLTDIYYEGSEAEWNAIKIGLYQDQFDTATVHFASDAKPTYSLGDINADGSVNANDAAMLLSAAAAAGAGGDSGLNEAQIAAADLNADGSFDAVDAAIILQYAAYAGAGGKDSIVDFVKTL